MVWADERFVCFGFQRVNVSPCQLRVSSSCLPSASVSLMKVTLTFKLKVICVRLTVLGGWGGGEMLLLLN